MIRLLMVSARATTVQIIFSSMYGHIYRMAEASAEGAGQVADDGRALPGPGAGCGGGFAADRSGEHAGRVRAHSDATVEHLESVDAIIIGTPTRFGNICV